MGKLEVCPTFGYDGQSFLTQHAVIYEALVCTTVKEIVVGGRDGSEGRLRGHTAGTPLGDRFVGGWSR